MADPKVRQPTAHRSHRIHCHHHPQVLQLRDFAVKSQEAVHKQVSGVFSGRGVELSCGCTSASRTLRRLGRTREEARATAGDPLCLIVRL